MKKAKKRRRSWLSRLRLALTGRPHNRDEMTMLLRNSEKSNLIDHDILNMMEGVIQMSDMQARDIMIPRTSMVTVKDNQPFNEIVEKVVASGHSRVPVEKYDEDAIAGILLAKDLLNPQARDYPLLEIIRPAVFVPESKRLNTLLREFRHSHNHMAIVIDEYGNVAGLITIEDILEQIVGDIADEYDIEEELYIKQHSDHEYIIKATTPLLLFNEQFNSQLDDQQVDTVGGFVINKLGYIPKRDDVINIEEFTFRIVRADRRRIHLLAMELKTL